MAILLKYYPYETLERFIKNASQADKQKVANKLKKRVRLLHEVGLIHGDLREENIVVLRRRRGIGVRLIDFGHSSFATKERISKEERKLEKLIRKLQNR